MQKNESGRSPSVLKHGVAIGAWTAVAVVLTGCSQLPPDGNLAALVDPSSQFSAPKRKDVDLERRFQTARQLEKSNDQKAAINAYRSLQQAYPDDPRAFHRLAVVYDKAGQFEEATGLYLRALQISDPSAELLADYGYSRYIQGDLVQAERTLQRALKLSPQHERAHNNLALVFARQGDDERALAAFQRSGMSIDQARQGLRQARAAIKLSEMAPSEAQSNDSELHESQPNQIARQTAARKSPTRDGPPKATASRASRSLRMRD